MGLELRPQRREALNKDERAKLESLREPARAVMEELGPLLEEKAVSGIVGVDASGRPITRLVSEIVRRMQGKGVPTHFLPSRGMGSIEEKIKRMRLPKQGTILLVDDTYAFGTSLDPIEAELRALGYVVRVVAFYDRERQLLLKHPDAFIGIHDEGSETHRTPTLSGVQNRGEPYATVLRSVTGIPPLRFRKKIARSRELINNMADEIVAAYRQK